MNDHPKNSIISHHFLIPQNKKYLPSPPSLFIPPYHHLPSQPIIKVGVFITEWAKCLFNHQNMETEVVMVYPWHFTDHGRCIKNNWFKLKSKWLRQVLCVFSVHFNRISIFTLYNNCVHLSVICILINLFHLLVLTRKPLRSSPIYIILTTIAILDIISLSYDVHMEIAEFYRVMKVCYPKETDYNILLIKNIMEFIRNYTRRCSTWHSFSIALIRTLIIKNPINPKFEILSKPKIAFYVIPTILILCAPIHLMDIYKYEIEIYDEHYKCTQYPEYTTYFYGNTVSAMFQKDDNRIQKINRMIDAIISKVSLQSCVLQGGKMLFHENFAPVPVHPLYSIPHCHYYHGYRNPEGRYPEAKNGKVFE